MQPRDPRSHSPDERARARAGGLLASEELRALRGGIDTVPLPETPAFWLRRDKRSTLFLKP